MDKTTSELSDITYKVFTSARDGLAITLYAILCAQAQDEVDRILQHQTEEEGQRTTPFLIAARNGYEKVVRLLLTHFKVDIEQVGMVKFDGYIIEGATALWCSAGAGHYETVKTLLEFGANVNHPTFSNSTPLRAACFDGRLDIVKYLIENRADIHIPNKYNNTCLMIACYKGHSDVVQFLLENGANPNAKAHCGATALHFSADRGHLAIVKELVKFGASMLPNDQGMTPIHIASDSGQVDIVEFFITQPQCGKRERIEALELLGASFANDKDNYDIEKAYHYLWLAMMERYANAQDLLHKEVHQPVDAYDNRLECQTVAQLAAIKDDHEALHMEALIARERILGADNAEIPHPVIFRGAVFADTARFDRCTALWMRAMKLRQRNDRTITKDLLRFAQVFSQMVHVGVDVEFQLAEEVMEHALLELQKDKERVARFSGDELTAQTEIFDSNIHTSLYILVILTKIKSPEEEEFRLCRMAYRFNKLELRIAKSGASPLHLVADENTVVDDFHVNDVVLFPCAPLMQLLVKCGADVNAVDKNSNTPLHVIVKYTKPISNFMALHGIIMSLIEAGAHMDMRNSEGQSPTEASSTGVAEIILRTQGKLSLKCISATAVKKHQLEYRGHIPVSLEEFVDIH